ncbi:phosphotransferase [Pseudomonas sp. PCH199]|uniref:phosphotransferase enzyme family protein n=1 Tax=unclassified Pseudomonas TaxID=196821 RepID=UPI000BCBECE9|nr:MULTISPECIES: phosphotransferase [unclassified Pseudomonas]MCW8278484.1 phosphotransferase [Pseudomonas sp. PCH199]PAM81272.1 aminoglycoside phosphotransferase [Pseudomonas sp. ERMR1:02]
MTEFHALSHDQQIARLHDLARHALQHWEGDFADIELVKFRENAVFSARRHDGQRVALRIHRNGYHCEAALRSELQWMEALESAGITVPQIIRARDLRHLIEVRHAEVGERHVDMLAWLPGATAGTSEAGVQADTEIDFLFNEAGAIAARIHLHSAQWQQPDEFIRHAWDEEGLIGANPFWGRFWELDQLSDNQRDLLLQARRQARRDLRQYGRHLHNFGMIHADLVPENLLIEGPQLRLIDFDDAGFGWHMFELATALYFCLDDPRYEQIKAALLEGYHAVKPLTEADRQTLALFLMLRGTTYLGWIHTRQGTQTAIEMAPMLIERACRLAGEYLQQ